MAENISKCEKENTKKKESKEIIHSLHENEPNKDSLSLPFTTDACVDISKWNMLENTVNNSAMCDSKIAFEETNGHTTCSNIAPKQAPLQYCNESTNGVCEEKECEKMEANQHSAIDVRRYTNTHKKCDIVCLDKGGMNLCKRDYVESDATNSHVEAGDENCNKNDDCENKCPESDNTNGHVDNAGQRNTNDDEYRSINDRDDNISLDNGLNESGANNDFDIEEAEDNDEDEDEEGTGNIITPQNQNDEENSVTLNATTPIAATNGQGLRSSSSRGHVRVAGRPPGPPRPPVMDTGLADDFNDLDEDELFFFAPEPVIAETAPDLTPGELLAQAAQGGVAAIVNPLVATEAAGEAEGTPPTAALETPSAPPLEDAGSGPWGSTNETPGSGGAWGSSDETPPVGPGTPPVLQGGPSVPHGTPLPIHLHPRLNRNDARGLSVHGAANRETAPVHPDIVSDVDMSAAPGASVVDTGTGPRPVQQPVELVVVGITALGGAGGGGGSGVAGGIGGGGGGIIEGGIGGGGGLREQQSDDSIASSDPSMRIYSPLRISPGISRHPVIPHVTEANSGHAVCSQPTSNIHGAAANTGTDSLRNRGLLEDDSKEITAAGQRGKEGDCEIDEGWNTTDGGTERSTDDPSMVRTAADTCNTEECTDNESQRFAEAENDFLSLDVRRNSSSPVIDPRARTEQDADALLNQIIAGRQERGMGPNAALEDSGETSNLATRLLRSEPMEDTIDEPESGNPLVRDDRYRAPNDPNDHKPRRRRCGGAGGCNESPSALSYHELGHSCSDSIEMDNVDETSHGIPDIHTNSASHATSQGILTDMMVDASSARTCSSSEDDLHTNDQSQVQGNLIGVGGRQVEENGVCFSIDCDIGEPSSNDGEKSGLASSESCEYEPREAIGDTNANLMKCSTTSIINSLYTLQEESDLNIEVSRKGENVEEIENRSARFEGRIEGLNTTPHVEETNDHLLRRMCGEIGLCQSAVEIKRRKVSGECPPSEEPKVAEDNITCQTASLQTHQSDAGMENDETYSDRKEDVSNDGNQESGNVKMKDDNREGADTCALNAESYVGGFGAINEGKHNDSTCDVLPNNLSPPDSHLRVGKHENKFETNYNGSPPIKVVRNSPKACFNDVDNTQISRNISDTVFREEEPKHDSRGFKFTQEYITDLEDNKQTTLINTNMLANVSGTSANPPLPLQLLIVSGDAENSTLEGNLPDDDLGNLSPPRSVRDETKRGACRNVTKEPSLLELTASPSAQISTGTSKYAHTQESNIADNENTRRSEHEEDGHILSGSLQKDINDRSDKSSTSIQDNVSEADSLNNDQNGADFIGTNLRKQNCCGNGNPVCKDGGFRHEENEFTEKRNPGVKTDNTLEAENYECMYQEKASVQEEGLRKLEIRKSDLDDIQDDCANPDDSAATEANWNVAKYDCSNQNEAGNISECLHEAGSGRVGHGDAGTSWSQLCESQIDSKNGSDVDVVNAVQNVEKLEKSSRSKDPSQEAENCHIDNNDNADSVLHDLLWAEKDCSSYDRAGNSEVILCETENNRDNKIDDKTISKTSLAAENNRSDRNDTRITEANFHRSQGKLVIQSDDGCEDHDSVEPEDSCVNPVDIGATGVYSSIGGKDYLPCDVDIPADRCRQSENKEDHQTDTGTNEEVPRAIEGYIGDGVSAAVTSRAMESVQVSSEGFDKTPLLDNHRTEKDNFSKDNAVAKIVEEKLFNCQEHIESHQLSDESVNTSSTTNDHKHDHSDLGTGAEQSVADHCESSAFNDVETKVDLGYPNLNDGNMLQIQTNMNTPPEPDANVSDQLINMNCDKLSDDCIDTEYINAEDYFKKKRVPKDSERDRELHIESGKEEEDLESAHHAESDKETGTKAAGNASLDKSTESLGHSSMYEKSLVTESGHCATTENNSVSKILPQTSWDVTRNSCDMLKTIEDVSNEFGHERSTEVDIRDHNVSQSCSESARSISSERCTEVGRGTNSQEDISKQGDMRSGSAHSLPPNKVYEDIEPTSQERCEPTGSVKSGGTPVEDMKKEVNKSTVSLDVGRQGLDEYPKISSSSEFQDRRSSNSGCDDIDYNSFNGERVVAQDSSYGLVCCDDGQSSVKSKSTGTENTEAFAAHRKVELYQRDSDADKFNEDKSVVNQTPTEKVILEATDLWLRKISDFCKSPTILSDSRSDAKIHEFTAECKSRILSISKCKLGSSASVHGAENTAESDLVKDDSKLRNINVQSDKVSPKEKLPTKHAFGAGPRQRNVRPSTRPPLSSVSGDFAANKYLRQPRPPQADLLVPPHPPQQSVGGKSCDGELFPLPLSTLGSGDVYRPGSGGTQLRKDKPQPDDTGGTLSSARSESDMEAPADTQAAQGPTAGGRPASNRHRRRFRTDANKNISGDSTQEACSPTSRSPRAQQPPFQRLTSSGEASEDGKTVADDEHPGAATQGDWPWQKPPPRRSNRVRVPDKSRTLATDDATASSASSKPRHPSPADTEATTMTREKMAAPTLHYKKYRPQRILTVKEFEKEQLTRHINQDFRRINKAGPSVDCHMNPYVMGRAKASVERQRAKNNYNSLLALENCRFLHVLRYTKSVYHGNSSQGVQPHNTKARSTAQQSHPGEPLPGRRGSHIPTTTSATGHTANPGIPRSAWGCSQAGDHVGQWAGPVRGRMRPRPEGYIQTKVKVRPSQPPSYTRKV